ncbi:sulfatase family protein [Spirosoma arcticum]
MRLLLALLTLSLFFGDLALKLPVPTADTRPNVLFIIADDWGFPHAGVYGDPVVKTPHFDKLAREGVLFTDAHCTAPSCSPSRAAILTGRYPHTLREGANLWGTLPNEFATFPQVLKQAGYETGSFSKGWGPGDFTAGGYTHNPAGPETKDYRGFFKGLPAEKPFCFWLGTYDPHRPYEVGSGRKAGFDPAKVNIPPFLPDAPIVREDITDYYAEVQRFDAMIGDAVQLLDSLGRLDNTLIIVTSDNGMPFPRSKARMYDAGTRIPLAIYWKGKIKPARPTAELVNLIDVAPTVFAALNVAPPSEMHGLNLWPLLTGKTSRTQPAIFLERERHANARLGNLSYPSRAIRTNEFLYVANLRPDRYPAGDGDYENSQGIYNDVDTGPTKTWLLAHRNETAVKLLFDLATAKMPAEELYDLKKDPFQMVNVATDKKYATIRQRFGQQLANWMKQTNDPRLDGKGDEIDRYIYYGKSRRE